MRRILREQKQTPSQLKEDRKRISDSISIDKKELEDLGEKLKDLASQIKISEEKKEAIKREIFLLENHLIERKARVREIDKQALEKEEELKNKKEKLEKCKEETKNRTEEEKNKAEKEISEKREVVKSLIKEVADLGIKKKISEKELDSFSEQARNTFSRIEDLDKIVFSNRAFVKSQEDALFKNSEKIKELEIEIKDKNNTSEVLKEKIEELERQYKEKETQLTILKEEILRLETKKEQTEKELKANESRILNITRREEYLNSMKSTLKELYEKAGIKVNLE